MIMVKNTEESIKKNALKQMDDAFEGILCLECKNVIHRFPKKILEEMCRFGEQYTEAAIRQDLLEDFYVRKMNVLLGNLAFHPDYEEIKCTAYRKAAQKLGITVSYDSSHNSLDISYPALLPHRKADLYVKSGIYVGAGLEPLEHSLKYFWDSEASKMDVFPYEKADIIVDNVSVRDVELIRDADNHELKAIIDMLPSRYIKEDGWQHLALHIISRQGTENKTLIHCVKSENFLQWYEWYNNQIS